jgi:hypothetical protein
LRSEAECALHYRNTRLTNSYKDWQPLRLLGQRVRDRLSRRLQPPTLTTEDLIFLHVVSDCDPQTKMMSLSPDTLLDAKPWTDRTEHQFLPCCAT